MPFKRLKAKFGKKDPPTSPRVEALPTSTTPHARTAPDPATFPPGLPARLWNQAYDQAKTSDSSTVDEYEKILSARLSQQDADASNPPHSADLASQQNEIAQDADKRRMQMQQLVKQGMEDGIQAAMAVKDVVDKAIQASPEAAVAWVGVCFALEILMNPLTQASSNRQGIAYVVSRTDWYWNLSSLLLDENIKEAHSPGLRDELEKVVAQLYAKLLLYQMKSVCYYHRGRLSVFARDLIKLDNWDGELSDIQAAEAAVQADSAQYNTLSIRTQLGAIAETAKSQNAKLDSISSAIREQTKQQERMHEISADNKCLKDLHLTDPRDDKKRIEETKGGLLKDAYRWILDNADFRQWRDNPQNQLLWVKANPGKGKTMLLCGIIDELQYSMDATDLLSYFFCQATDSRIRSAVAVLRGLLYLLVSQQPSLISHVRRKYDHAGKTLFEDANAWVALTEIFTSILQDPSLKCTYLVVDALDECITDLPKLLEFVAQQSSTFSCVKWIVSSRNWQDIEERLDKVRHKVKLSLELNAQSVSSAVTVFIRHKVLQLAGLKTYDDKTRDTVLDHLFSNANDTFLWVALVCQSLGGVPRRNVIKKLNAFPPGLDSLYGRMMQQISNSDDASLCKQILALATIAYQPTTLEELPTLVEQLEDVADDPKSIREIIGLCGSFLTLRKDTIYFVHQSAKDFLSTKASHDIFPSGIEDAHYVILSRSLQAMSTLHRDMYSLGKLGYPADQIIQPNSNPLAALRYSCIYWIDHLCDWSLSASADFSVALQDGGAVHEFVRKKYLYWLEALSLCKSMSKGVVSIAKLETLTYASALLFSPTGSLIREHFKDEELQWITIKPSIGDQWSACLQTLEGHSDSVMSVAFSHDSARLASASFDKTIKLWDANSGECLQTLKGHSDWVNSVAFTHNLARLASASSDYTVKLWDANSGECLYTLKGHSHWAKSIAFSHDSARLASASSDKTVKLWDTNSGECLQTRKQHSDTVHFVAFSHDSARLASMSTDSTVKIWDTNSGECLQTLEGHSNSVQSVAFSYNSAQLTSVGECLQTLIEHSDWVSSVAFSYNSARLASAGECLQTLIGHSYTLASTSTDSTVKIWDTNSGECLSTLEGHSDMVHFVTFSHDSARLAMTSTDSTVKIWDTNSGDSVAFSHDSAWLASASYDCTVKLWDANSGECLQILSIGKTLRRISFDITAPYLHTDIGNIKICVPPGLPSPLPSNTEPQNPQYQGLALSADGVWITYSSENLVWLPSEYRPVCSAVSGKTIGVGVGSGRVWMCNV
ncbi:hypothetical protein BDY21DRAFT_383665 [Lineolata rhizophorae]|uniref:Mitochondrial division protein 1 n=1 Tax=Lineolata rhizophorae TaxID=578093 RepID=A0A6A6PAN3_9PEZI|nr:hypothetical protein BDY21DRAFT_383665 [Lineolata rhizophorae]